MLKAVIFDFDGTLADTAPAIVATMKQTFREMGLPEPEEELIKSTIGLPLEGCCRISGNLEESQVEVAASTYRRIFNDYAATHTKVYPGVVDTMNALAARGLRLAIATSRGPNSLDLVLRTNSIEVVFETRVTGHDGYAPKPAPDMVLVLLERMGLTPDEALVVGDTTFDIEMGNGAGCRTCAVTYGNHSREKLLTANPTCHIDSMPELMDIPEVSEAGRGR